MANIGNQQARVGDALGTIGTLSLAPTRAPLPTTIIPLTGAAENIIFDNGGSALIVPPNYAFALNGGLEGSTDSVTGFIRMDGAQFQAITFPDRGFQDADFPMGFNGATVQHAGLTAARQRWPDNGSSGAIPVDFRNATIVGQVASIYAGAAGNLADAWLFHLGAGDTGNAFNRTGSLVEGNLDDRFTGVALEGISFSGAITLQIPADVDYIAVAFPDYNKTVAATINNLRITAPKGGARRTMIKDGSLPFGTGLRAQDAGGRVVIMIGDASMFVRYQNPNSYSASLTDTFTETYSAIVTGGVNAGTAGDFYRGYGWKPRLLDVSTGVQIEDGFVDFNLPSGHFVIQPSTDNQVIPPQIATSASGAISHSVADGDNAGYWIITSSASPSVENTATNIDTAVVYTPVTQYFMSHLVESDVTPVHVPTGTTVESFDELRAHIFQYSVDNLVGDRTFANANADTVGNSNATLAYAAVKRANRDTQSGPFGTLIDTSTNGAAEVFINGNLVFSGSLPTALTSTGNVAVRVGSGFVGGLNNGATHNRWSASQITLASGTTYADIAFEATGNLICIGAAFTNTITLGGNIIGLPSTFSGTIENGSTVVVDADAQFNLEGAVIEGVVTLTSNEIGGTDVILDGDFTGTFAAGTGVNNIIIPVLYTVEPSLIAGTNGFFAIRNITTNTTVVDVTILNGVIQGNSFFEVDATSAETYLAFYKLNSSTSGGQVYRVATLSFSGTSLSRNTLVQPLTVPAPFTASATGVKPDGDGGDAVTLSYGQNGNALIGTWVNNTSQPTRPNAFETMTAVIEASNASGYFGWMESRGLTIDPTDYSSDGATVFNNSVDGLQGLSTNDGIRWNSEMDTGQSQVSQAAGFFSDNVTGVTVQQILSFDIGNAPLGTVSAALAPQLAALPTASELDTLGDEIKQNQQMTADGFGNVLSPEGINQITLPNQPS